MELFAVRGIRSTRVEEVAREAGVTRMTVHRHFGGKEGLVQAVLERLGEAFHEASARARTSGENDPETYLAQAFQPLLALNRTSMVGRLGELRVLYPKLHSEYQAVRRQALGDIWDGLTHLLDKQGMLRQNPRPEVGRALFQESFASAQRPEGMPELAVPREELMRSLLRMLLYGIAIPPEQGR
jgi:AcrR family transcriptional regulator